LSLYYPYDELSPVVGANPFDENLVFVSIAMMAKNACQLFFLDCFDMLRFQPVYPRVASIIVDNDEEIFEMAIQHFFRPCQEVHIDYFKWFDCLPFRRLSERKRFGFYLSCHTLVTPFISVFMSVHSFQCDTYRLFDEFFDKLLAYMTQFVVREI
jgi:hypothetical protein